MKEWVTFVKEGLESRWEQKCKKAQDLIVKLSLLTMNAKSIDHESSDAVKFKLLRGQME